MKRRWTILFAIALSPLVGMSWLASKIGMSLWSFFNFGLVGMTIAAAVAALAMHKAIERKWPAVVVLLASAPMAMEMLRVVGSIGELYEYIGPSLVLIVLGSLAVSIAAITILALPLPSPPQPPPIAPARVVD